MPAVRVFGDRLPSAFARPDSRRLSELDSYTAPTAISPAVPRSRTLRSASAEDPPTRHRSEPSCRNGRERVQLTEADVGNSSRERGTSSDGAARRPPGSASPPERTSVASPGWNRASRSGAAADEAAAAHRSRNAAAARSAGGEGRNPFPPPDQIIRDDGNALPVLERTAAEPLVPQSSGSAERRAGRCRSWSGPEGCAP